MFPTSRAYRVFGLHRTGALQGGTWDRQQGRWPRHGAGSQRRSAAVPAVTGYLAHRSAGDRRRRCPARPVRPARAEGERDSGARAAAGTPGERLR